MFPPKKRKLYTPITPPSQEEVEVNKVNVAEEPKTTKHEKEIETFKTVVSEKFSFKHVPIEMAENVEWKKLKPLFLKDPVSPTSSVFQWNSVVTANANVKNIASKKDENLNILDVVAQKLIKERSKVETPINPHNGQQQQSIEIKCEHLKSVFVEHSESIAVEATATDSRGKSAQGFISSHFKPSIDTESSDNILPAAKRSVNKPLITQDMFNECFSDLSSSTDSPRDGFFPPTPSLSRVSKLIYKKGRSNTNNNNFLCD